jgi:hypothetical protein
MLEHLAETKILEEVAAAAFCHALLHAPPGCKRANLRPMKLVASTLLPGGRARQRERLPRAILL